MTGSGCMWHLDVRVEDKRILSFIYLCGKGTRFSWWIVLVIALVAVVAIGFSLGGVK
jgi:hypothetical protein